MPEAGASGSDDEEQGGGVGGGRGADGAGGAQQKPNRQEELDDIRRSKRAYGKVQAAGLEVRAAPLFLFCLLFFM